MIVPAHVTGLMRHFIDLRDGVHGDAVSRRDKEAVFAREVDFLSPVARQALREVNTYLLLDSGTGPLAIGPGRAGRHYCSRARFSDR